jgi:3-oxoacyl-[acyl-carrier protein] reductase
MDLELHDRIALVLGGGGGLGGAAAAALAREGARVAVADIDDGALEATRTAIAAAGGTAIGIVWDLSDPDAIDSHVATVEAELGGVDILVNITGGPPPTPVSGQEVELWQNSFTSMVLAVIKITDRVLPGMRARRWGRIVTSVSSGVISPIRNLGLSNSLRSALVGWSKTLAGEIARDGVTANLVVPGRIGTQRIKFLDESKAAREGRSVEDVMAESVAAIPAGRYGDPAEYADAISFLASARASYITGATLRVDGGYISSV